jgi:hypothetical protein
MKAHARLTFIALTCPVLALLGAAAAIAAPAALTDRQLDGVTAGGAIVASTTDAAAMGAFSLTGTTSNSIVVHEPSPFPGNPGLGPAGGVTDGTALAVGNNVTVPGQPAPTTATNVMTAGAADGNLVINSSVNHTTQGAGGVTFQAGWTFVYGAFVGL